jgi:hypothetical protein
MSKLILSSFIFLFSFTNRIYITGYFKDLRKVRPISTSHQQLILMLNKKVIATTKTDASSYYELDFLDEFSRTESLNFYYVKNKDTVLLKSITQLESDDFKLDLYMPPINKKQSKRR